ncbi:putative gustatory receptor 59d [Drosophila subpulchrella]|uniref:putative gustatory receptor 59d n=1 Tax=Drosophila subpulchrella TaxID=1486046 RepID=UPI0018A13195|nr:putative gustatory receptor 59d [Drosophila subpulchrella]
MVDLFKWCLSYSYFIGRLTGMVNFEIDFKTGRAQVTTRASISAVCSNLVIFIMLTVYVLNVREIVKTWELPNRLQEDVLIILSFFRIMCIFLTLASRWWKREEFMQVFDAFCRQYSPEILPYCRRRVLFKIFCATMVDTVHIVITMLMMRKLPTFSMVFGTWGLFSTTVIVHVIIMQYYMAMASVRGRYILLNKELQALISETQSLNPNLMSPEFVMLIYTSLIVLYFVDFSMNGSNIVGLLDIHEEMLQLLSQRTLFQPGLDQRSMASL